MIDFILDTIYVHIFTYAHIYIYTNAFNSILYRMSYFYIEYSKILKMNT